MDASDTIMGMDRGEADVASAGAGGEVGAGGVAGGGAGGGAGMGAGGQGDTEAAGLDAGYVRGQKGKRSTQPNRRQRRKRAKLAREGDDQAAGDGAESS